MTPEVVEVVVGATLGSRVDCPLGRVANCRLCLSSYLYHFFLAAVFTLYARCHLVAKTACVHLVSKLGLVWNRTPGLAFCYKIKFSLFLVVENTLVFTTIAAIMVLFKNELLKSNFTVTLGTSNRAAIGEPKARLE